jgi:hypothetical protein
MLLQELHGMIAREKLKSDIVDAVDFSRKDDALKLVIPDTAFLRILSVVLELFDPADEVFLDKRCPIDHVSRSPLDELLSKLVKILSRFVEIFELGILLEEICVKYSHAHNLAPPYYLLFRFRYRIPVVLNEILSLLKVGIIELYAILAYSVPYIVPPDEPYLRIIESIIKNDPLG